MRLSQRTKLILGICLQTFVFLGVSEGLKRMGVFSQEGPRLLIAGLCGVVPFLWWAEGSDEILRQMKESRSVSWKYLLCLLCVCVAFNVIGVLCGGPIEGFLKTLGFTAKNSAFEELTTQQNAIFLFYSCLLGPVLEELIYRGGVQDLLEPYGARRAVLFSAILFGFMHHDLYQALSAFGTGLVFGYVKLHRGLTYAMILHILNNTFATITTLYKPLGFLTVLVALCGILILLFALVRKKISWTNLRGELVLATGQKHIDLPLLLLLAYEFMYTIISSIRPL